MEAAPVATLWQSLHRLWLRGPAQPEPRAAEHAAAPAGQLAPRPPLPPRPPLAAWLH